MAKDKDKDKENEAKLRRKLKGEAIRRVPKTDPDALKKIQEKIKKDKEKDK